MSHESLKQVVESRSLFRALLSLPGLLSLYAYSAGTLSYGEFIHASGDWSARLLLVALLATPLRMFFPAARFPAWLTVRRRDLGVATFVYAVLHATVYLARKADLSLVLREGGAPDLWTGWLAFAVFALLAITSNDASVRMLRSRWKKLHRLVYVGAILMFAHWLLTAFDMTVGLIYASIFAAIEALRVSLSLWRAGRRMKSA